MTQIDLLIVAFLRESEADSVPQISLSTAACSRDWFTWLWRSKSECFEASLKLPREASYFQTGNSPKSVSLTVDGLWTIQMTPIGPLGKMASTVRLRGTPSMRNRSVLWRKTSRMIGHPTLTKFGDKRASTFEPVMPYNPKSTLMKIRWSSIRSRHHLG